ncbi:hypothetical protein [Streptomyces sp. KR80]|uniref:hypothetical protein n=1 Tax=Streptomyces sp. KR80 TaxID=3457426 RepID=UPI003FD2C88F
MPVIVSLPPHVKGEEITVPVPGAKALPLASDAGGAAKGEGTSGPRPLAAVTVPVIP